MVSRDPRLGPVVVSMLEETSDRCGYCGKPMAGSKASSHPLAPPLENRSHYFVYMPWYHRRCGEVQMWQSRIYGLSQGLQHQWIKKDKALSKTLHELANRFYKAYDEWADWFGKTYGDSELARLEGRKE